MSHNQIETDTIQEGSYAIRYETDCTPFVSFFCMYGRYAALCVGKKEDVPMEQKQNTFLETEKLTKLMRKYAVPCVISLIVGALYNIVDQIFIANADYLGSYGNAANTVVFPLTVLALAVAVMIGDGCCAFVSIALGSGKKEDANRSVGNSIVLCIASSLVLTAIYLIFSEPILTLFGGKVNAETYDFAKEYFFWIAVGIPFYMFGQAMNPIIRSDGSPKFAMVSTLVGAVANIILDPIFIYIFKWGMMGAAVATVIGQILTAVLAVLYLCHMKAVRIEKSSFKLNFRLICRFLSLGLTSFLAQVSLVISMAAVQNTCMKYGALDPIFGQTEYAQIPLAVLGIVMKFFQIAISVSIGVAAGCIPIVGYNIGANRKDRAKTLFSYLLVAEAIIGGVATIIVECFPLQIANLFGAANESAYYADFAVKCFRIYLCMMILATVNKGTFIFLQALGKAAASTVVSLTREIIFGVFLPIIMPIFMGLDGLLWSFPVADILTFLIAVFFIRQTFRELSSSPQKELSETNSIS
jgi:putative MATE family efflux protein